MNVSYSNGTNIRTFRMFQESSTLKGMRIFSFACIFVIGFLGNLLTMIAARRRRLQNVTNMFIANLSLADFTVSVVNIPLNIGQASLGYWPYGFTMCKVAPYLQGTTVCASIGMLVAIATERFLVIVKPIKYKLATRQAHAIVGAIWVLSFIVPIPVLVFSQLVTANLGDKTYSGCFEIWPTRSLQTAYQMFLFVALFLCPMLTISVMYVLIEKALRSAEWLQRVTRLVHRRIVRMLIAVVLLFAVCWLPFHAVLLYQDTQEPRETDSLVSLVLFVQWLVYANSACNPVVYAILNRGFRTEFLAIIRCKTR